MTAADYKRCVEAPPRGKRLPSATYLLDSADSAGGIPAKLRFTVAELRSRLGIGLEFNILKFHAPPKISFLAYPGFEKVPHPALEEAVVVDLVTGKIRRDDYRGRVDALVDAWKHARRLMVVSTLVAGQEAYDDIRTYGEGVITSRNTFQKFFEPAEIQSLIEDSLHTEAVPVGLGIYFVFRSTADLHDFLASRSRRFIDWESLSRKLGLLRALKSKVDPYEEHRELLDGFWERVLELGRLPRDDEFELLADVRKACGSLPKALQLFIDRFGEPTFAAARQRRKEDLLVFVAAAQLRRKIPFNHLSDRLQRDLRSFFGSYANAEDKARDLMFAAGDEDELELAIQGLGFGHLDEKEGHFTIHRSLLDELRAILRVYVECGARLYGDPRAADLIKIHLHSRKLTFTHYEDFEGQPFPELVMRIKIDLKRRFVTVFERFHHVFLSSIK